MDRKAKAYQKSIQGRIEAARAQVLALKELRQGYDEFMDDSDSLLSDAPAPQQVPISESIDRYIAETGKDELSAADIKRYLEGQGYTLSQHSYNSIYETLTRRVKAGKLVKAEGKFKVVHPS